MNGLTSLLRSVREWRESPSGGREADSPEGPQSSLYQCSSCDTVYIATEMQRCPSCDTPVEQVPSTLTQAGPDRSSTS